MIHFDKDRMAAVVAAHEAWWDGKLDRPLVKICITDAYPAEKVPPVPLLSQANCHDFSVPVDDLLDTIELSLSRREFLGDAFPFFNFDCFGPGIVAAGKGIHVVEEPQNLLDVCEALGSGKGLYASYNLRKQDVPIIEELLELR